MKKSLGKPYAGKPHVRFDEGVTKLTSFVSFVLYSTGIENTTIDNSAAYIGNWLKKLKSDSKFIVMAASYAQKAVDYILEHQKGSVKIKDLENLTLVS